MKYGFYLLIVLLICSVYVKAQDQEISSLFPGKWKMEIENAEVFEVWTLFFDTTLVGTSYTVKDGKINNDEQILLRKIENNWEYIAKPDNQNITRFLLVEHSSKKFTFENKEHDFPQRITYEFHKDGKMTAAIEGNLNGEFKRKEFSYRLVEN